MTVDLPTGETVAASTDSSTWLITGAVLAAGIFFIPAFSCTCGHLDWLAAPLTTAMAGVGWWAFLMDRQKQFVPRTVEILAVIVGTLVFLKNAGDILWFGHGPLFHTIPWG